MNSSRCTRCKQCKHDVTLLEDPYVAVVFGETMEHQMCQDCFELRKRDITLKRPSRPHGLFAGALASVKQRFYASAA